MKSNTLKTWSNRLPTLTDRLHSKIQWPNVNFPNGKVYTVQTDGVGWSRDGILVCSHCGEFPSAAKFELSEANYA